MYKKGVCCSDHFLIMVLSLKRGIKRVVGGGGVARGVEKAHTEERKVFFKGPLSGWWLSGVRKKTVCVCVCVCMTRLGGIKGLVSHGYGTFLFGQSNKTHHKMKMVSIQFIFIY